MFDFKKILVWLGIPLISSLLAISTMVSVYGNMMSVIRGKFQLFRTWNSARARSRSLFICWITPVFLELPNHWPVLDCFILLVAIEVKDSSSLIYQ